MSLHKSPLFYALLIAYINIMILNTRYPHVGLDFYYFVPRLLDTLLYYLKNAFEIQWWSPSFGGGLPSYPNPQQIQFSLPQMLTFFVNPWTAINITVAVFTLIGFYGTYFLSRLVMGLKKDEAMLGGVLFSVTGFFIEHLSTGHLGYHGFTLLPVVILLFLSSNIRVWTCGIIIGLFMSYLTYSAGFYLFVVFAFSVALSLLTVQIVMKTSVFDVKRVLKIVAVSLAVFIPVSASKLGAVLDYMRYFPRLSVDVDGIGFVDAIVGLFLQLFYIPIYNFGFIKPVLGNNIRSLEHIHLFTDTKYGLQELDIGLSPVVLLLILSIFFFKYGLLHLKNRVFNRKKIIYLIGVCLLSYLCIELIFLKGPVYALLKGAPFFKSLNVGVRFSSIFILPIIIFALYPYKYIKRRLKRPTNLSIILIVIAIMLYSTYYSVSRITGNIIVNINSGIASWEVIKDNYKDMKIEKVLKVPEPLVFITRSSSTMLYEPLFGYNLKDFKTNVREGAVNMVRDGYYNITNPASLIYPELNNLRPFQLITENDKDNFYKFINYEKPDWKVSKRQRALNYLALLVFVVCLAKLLTTLILYIKNNYK